MATRALALLLLGLAGGCMTVRSAPAPFADVWPPRETGPRPAIVLVVSGLAAIDGIPRPLGPILDPWGAATERAYRESALFAAIGRASGRGDLRIEVELRADLSQNVALTTFSYLTLFVIPNVETTEIAMTTRVVTDDGRPLGTFEARGSSRTWYHLLLLPVAPFFEPRTVTPDVVYDLSRETITMLHARGVF